MRVFVINGSYRKGGATDQYVDAVCAPLLAQGAVIDRLVLRDVDIAFCTNCRICMQHPGDAPGACPLHDGLEDIVARMEASDAFVFASPTNAGSVTAIFRRLIERLVVYGYWPWGNAVPALRKAKNPQKKAILLATCAAPGPLGRLAFSTLKQMRSTAKMIGAKTCGTLFSGLHAMQEHAQLTPKQVRNAERLAKKLL